MLLRAFSAGLQSYEFLGGDDPWKQMWTNSYRERMLFQAFERSLLSSVEWTAFRYGRPLAQRLSKRLISLRR